MILQNAWGFSLAGMYVFITHRQQPKSNRLALQVLNGCCCTKRCQNTFITSLKLSWRGATPSLLKPWHHLMFWWWQWKVLALTWHSRFSLKCSTGPWFWAPYVFFVLFSWSSNHLVSICSCCRLGEDVNSYLDTNHYWIDLVRSQTGPGFPSSLNN